MTDACICPYDPPSLYRQSRPLARIEHRCAECDSTIHPGERYERVFGIWEGESGVVRTCPRCLALRDYVQAHVPCFCWAHGNTREDAIAAASAYAHEAPGLLFAALRREVAIRRHWAAELHERWGSAAPGRVRGEVSSRVEGSSGAELE
ncbi:hypothetical protein CKO31_24105 [Thiohalocapsa halophila]|uniref:Uncharacterized protein n=1 Tax=Thiohalocapsa halophila TaxID=69359 RepID=A0ABS1CP98_9GAMM|nr:hypothetical protein [Thiohalocapsa halophila]MBK1633766.1 hypothetical protein [Thiohalocapsa halophila]